MPKSGVNRLKMAKKQMKKGMRTSYSMGSTNTGLRPRKKTGRKRKY